MPRILLAEFKQVHEFAFPLLSMEGRRAWIVMLAGPASTTTKCKTSSLAAVVMAEYAPAPQFCSKCINGFVRAPGDDDAIAFAEFRALQQELDDTRLKLADRRDVDKAKGLLMKRRGMDENTAYETLRRMAMDRNIRLGEVARSLIAAAEAKDNHGEAVLGYVQRIHRAGAQMNRLIGDLLDLASIEAGCLAVTLEPGNPARLVKEALDTLAPEASAKGVSLAADLGPASILTSLDPERILQVLMNLLSNALKFTPSGGEVFVRLELFNNELRFSVSDTGAGIPPERLHAVFERYHQVKANDRRGTGLGLYISKCIVQGHGGRIWVDSAVGEGSTFYFTLPGAQA